MTEQTIAGFRTGKRHKPAHPGSLYAYGEKSGNAVRYKADNSEGDGGLKDRHFVGFINASATDTISFIIYHDIGSGNPSFSWPFYAELKSNVGDIDTDAMIPPAGQHIILTPGKYSARPVDRLPLSLDRKPHLIFPQLKREPDGTLARDDKGQVIVEHYCSLGPVELKPTVGLHPYETRRDSAGKFECHLGNEVLEVYPTRAALQKAIDKTDYPVHIAEDGRFLKGKYPPSPAVSPASARPAPPPAP